MEKGSVNKAVFNLEQYRGEDFYSYGDAAFEILDIVETNGGNYKKALKEYHKSDYLYQLSDLRENLLEWYEFSKLDSVLEIGSGCGALTGLFCRKAGHVVALDASKVNSTINYKRNIKCSNLELAVANIKDWHTEEKFDYVTMVGILNYAPVYFKEENAYLAMIRKAKNLLKPSGTLIVAGANKFGLKYFAGVREDHTGNFFDGIENYRKGQEVRTFSKMEITNLLYGAGMKDLNFFYPIPDYKLPTTIYNQRYLPKKGDLTNLSSSYDKPRYQLFEEEAVIDALCEDRKFEEFANSFMIFCTN